MANTSTRQRRVDSVSHFVESYTFQLAVAPAVMVVLERVIPSMLGFLGAAIATLVAWFGFWIWRSRRRRQYAELTYQPYDESDPASVLVFAASAPLDASAAARAQDLAEKVIAAWRPSVVRPVVTPQAQQGAPSGLWVIEEAAGEQGGVRVEPLHVLPEQAENPAQLSARLTATLGEAGPDVVVDVTGGTKPMSLGLFDAARDLGVRASYYLTSPGRDPSRRRPAADEEEMYLLLARSGALDPEAPDQEDIR